MKFQIDAKDNAGVILICSFPAEQLQIANTIFTQCICSNPDIESAEMFLIDDKGNHLKLGDQKTILDLMRQMRFQGGNGLVHPQ